MEAFKKVIFITALVCLSDIFTPVESSCSNVTSTSNATFAFLETGVWYVVNAGPSSAKYNNSCVKVDFSKLKSKSTIGVNYNGQQLNVPLKNVKVNQNNYNLDINILGVQIKGGIVILDADKDNFALVYACGSVKNFQQETAVVLSRKNVLSSEFYDRIKTDLSNAKLDSSLASVTFKKCK